MIEDRTIQTSTREIARRPPSQVQEHKVVRVGAVFAAADIADDLPVGGDAQVSKRAMRCDELLHRAVGDRNTENAIGVSVGFGMIGGDDDDAIAGGEPSLLVELPFGIGEGLAFAGCKCEKPETGVLVLFVDDTRVIFIFFFFLLGLGLRVGRQEGDLFAVRGPRKILYAALALGHSRSLTGIRTYHVNLLVIVPVREEGKLFSIGRPARGRLILRRKSELPDETRVLLVYPDVASTLRALGRFGDHESEPRSVRGELEIGNSAQIDRGL